MKRTFLAAIMMFMAVALTGCGDEHEGGHPPPPIVTDILSDSVLDGDIVQNPSGVFTVTQGMTQSVQSVFAGIDPATGAEYRAFLDFPLTGSGGVPGNANIESATLDIVIKGIQPLTGTIPIRIDLVNLQPPTLVAANFSTTSLAALATITIPIFQTDLGKHVFVDVTSLMSEAQRLVLPNFQIRILLDFAAVSGSAVSGRIEIDDTTGADRGALAPLLQVTYF